MKLTRYIIYNIIIILALNINLQGQGSVTARNYQGANNYQNAHPTTNKAKSKQHAIKAGVLRQRGNYQGALIEYDNAIAVDHYNHQLWLRKALIYITLKDWSNAVRSMNEVVALKKDYIKGYLILRKIHMQNRNYEHAIHSLDNAYKYTPKTQHKIRYKVEIIKLLEKMGQLRKAGKHIKHARVLLGSHPKILYYSSKYSNLNGKYQDAIHHAKSALDRINSDEPQKTAGIYYELGYAFHQLGQYPEAQKALRSANYGPYKKKVFKLTPTYYYKLAIGYYKIHQYGECKKLVQTALKIQPDYRLAHSLKIKLIEKKTNHIQIVKSLQKSIDVERDPEKKARKLAQLCEVYYTANAFSRALMAANKTLKISDNPSIALLKAMIYHEIEQNQNAIRVINNLLMEKGSRNQHDKAKYYFALGLFYEGLGNLKLAINNYKKADFGDFKYVAHQRLDSIKA